MGYYDNLLSAGYRYDPNAGNRGGFVRGDTRWNAATQRFDTNSNVGGTVFVPGRSGIAAAVAPVAPTAPAAASAPAPAAGIAAATAPWAGSARTRVNIPQVKADMIDMGIIPDAASAGIKDVRFAGVDPFTIEDDTILQELNRQAESDLKLGGALSAQEERDAQQAARAAFSARGMVYSDPAAAAEVLARDRFARERQAERRAFAGEVEKANQTLDLANQAAINRAEEVNAQGGLQAAIAGNESARDVFRTVTGARTSIATANQSAGLQAATSNQRSALEQQGMNDTWALGQDRLRADQAAAGLQAAVSMRGQDIGRETSIYSTQAGIYGDQMRALLQEREAATARNPATGSGVKADMMGGEVERGVYLSRAQQAARNRATSMFDNGIPTNARLYRPLGGGAFWDDRQYR